MKRCGRCKQWKFFACFYAMKKKSRDGLHWHCKECVKAECRELYATEAYRVAARERARRKRADAVYRAQDREKLRQWRAKNPERYRLQYEKRNAAVRGKYKRAPRVTDADKAKHLAQQNRRRARMLDGVSPGVSPEQWQQILDMHGRRCVYCGAAGKLTREHSVPICRGGIDSPDNVVPACQSCNSRKRHRTPEEFREYLRKVESHAPQP